MNWTAKSAVHPAIPAIVVGTVSRLWEIIPKVDRKLREKRVLAILAELGPWQTASGPLYHTLADAIRRAVERGALSGGLALPSERVLAEHLAVSRSTVVAAFDRLKREGWLVARRGSGTAVRHVGAGRAAPPEPALFTRADGGDQPSRARGAVDFSFSSPAALPWVAAEISRAARDLEAHALSHHGYDPDGIPALRQALADHYTARGLPTSPEQILVTSGAQQAIALCAHALVPPGGRALVESPAYPGTLDALRVAGATLAALEVDRAGLDLDALEHVLRAHRPHALFVSPTFNNPTGRTLDPTSREHLVDAAVRHGVPIVEDLTMEQIALDAPEAPLPPPLALVAEGTRVDGRRARVLTIGSAGKIFWGGLRVGWLRASAEDVAHLRRLKVAADLATSLPGQLAVLALVPQLARARRDRAAELAPRRDLLLRLLGEAIPAWLARKPEGGTALWATLPHGDGASFAQVAAGHGVAVVPGASFLPVAPPSTLGGPAEPHLRISFVAPPAVLEEGVGRLAAAWRTYRQGIGQQASRLVI